MKKVITYGTYDLFHQGHLNLLKRAKELGDYLIVGVTADAFDQARGKINVQQPLMERIESVKKSGLANEIIVEEYEGQKIDDILRYGVDVFTVGSDWVGKFDYLNEYCQVVYLPRTQGVSSSELRATDSPIRMKLIGEPHHYAKLSQECLFVNGIEVVENEDVCDAVYVISHPSRHYADVKAALLDNKHVLCESPLALTTEQCKELIALSEKTGRILMESLKTAYSTAYSRLLLLVKSGKIGNVLSVDTTCTSLRPVDFNDAVALSKSWNSICTWGPTALLPIFQILGTHYSSKQIVSKIHPQTQDYDLFSRVSFEYPHAVASIKVGNGIKSEGELVISGTKGYVIVPAPWWKTDYFEIRFEDQTENKRYFYQLDGEGIRYELVSFVKAIHTNKSFLMINRSISIAISQVMEDFGQKKDLIEI